MMTLNIMPNVLIIWYLFLAYKILIISIVSNRWEQMQLSNIQTIASIMDMPNKNKNSNQRLHI
jgi:hypothetical protein